MSIKPYVVAVLLGAVLVVSGCKVDKVEEKHHPAKLEETSEKGIMKITLEAQAVERIGLQTTQVAEEGGRLVLPYGSIMYDTKGQTWAFTNPAPLTYVRHKVVVEDIEGDRVILSEGPAAGTAVVTIGATELMGAEHKYGH
jgi:hypothetical protein